MLEGRLKNNRGKRCLIDDLTWQVCGIFSPPSEEVIAGGSGYSTPADNAASNPI